MIESQRRSLKAERIAKGKVRFHIFVQRRSSEYLIHPRDRGIDFSSREIYLEYQRKLEGLYLFS
ncbi:hypothetical protein H1P_6290023 [Hyella patelloides LEGE 07179]|uniref:Uncharacterized protein n=1 Tax=Hyella patelloides LEGE 07179 TaxID=945734 RepID=A0A563W242_9CYAN|nr:hypothetical protein [Hyella patelloides]VEP17603.1 hypothetical protein H1P_6290023 [Hyella patelloides LEGE 07179]